jgi:gliding motility-associated-like protein
VQIILPDSLIIQFQNTDPQCFGGNNGRVQLLVSGGNMPYRYSLDGGPFGGSSAYIGLPAGDYTLRVRDDHGCITEISTSLTNPPPITVLLGPDTTVVLGQPVLLSPEVNNAFGLTGNAWHSALLEHLVCVDTPACTELLVQPLFTNTYFLTVTDANGCTGKASQKVSVEKPRGVYVPTGFSPNGDLENDRLLVHGKSRQVRNIRLFRVYDRWGELVFEDRNFNVNDATRGWDGQWRGKDCDPGVYVWYLEAEFQDGYEETLKGEVTLIR